MEEIRAHKAKFDRKKGMSHGGLIDYSNKIRRMFPLWNGANMILTYPPLKISVSLNETEVHTVCKR